MLRSSVHKIFLVIIIIIHSFILTRVIFFPYPELFVYPYLTNNDFKPYQQILDQHFPGLLFLPLNFNNLGMTTSDAARLWLIVTVIITQVLLFFISRGLFKSERKALLVNLLYLIWQPFFEGWVLWIDSFLPLILLPAFYFLQKQKFFLSGLMLGLGIVFKQVLIPLSFLVFLYIIWNTKKVKIASKYLMGLTIPAGLMFLYLLSIGVLQDFWYWTIVFNLTVYREYGRGTGPTLAHFLRVALVFGAASLSFLKIKERQIQILLIFIFGTLFGLSTRFDFVHFQPALPFAILATVYMLGRFGRLGTLGMVGYILIAGWWLNIFYKGHIGDKVFFFDNQTKTVAQKIKEYSKKDEKIFVFGAPPHLYQMADRLPAGNIFVFQFPWFLKVAGGKVLEGVIMDRPKIVVSDRTVKIENQPITEFAKEIDQYIQENYEVIDQVGTTTLLRPKSP